ncbi:uncharacterized protein N7511_006083 [Penicillium nucicola]|uniref:uncharacterized protein n=1 Tax=Penicillium nucicola TaxID=1850975 RepID=UPI00254505CA|nr:uncharacterized protein N7511_006083 [Penicillium nucicola]KAJ5757389.1 hypothetical protein N7511_006083 [Penicillium nucicola]
MAEIEHIVLWSFKEVSDLEFAIQAIKATASNALRNGESYILSVKCGFNLASIVRFKCEDDRRYFVQEDPAHKNLIELVKGKLASGVLVLDFVDACVESVPTSEC